LGSAALFTLDEINHLEVLNGPKLIVEKDNDSCVHCKKGGVVGMFYFNPWEKQTKPRARWKSCYCGIIINPA